jgi:hypothetical protein
MAITKVSAALVDLDGGVVINESSADADFRVESNGNADMLFVDGGNDNVLLGTQNQGHIRLNQQLGLAVTGNVYGGISMATHSSSAGGNRSLLDFNRSRNTTIGSHTVVQSGDSLGTIVGRGDDGDEFLDAASIDFEVDGTPGNGDMPGRIVFSTTADGASSVSERMRIDSSGRVLIGTSTSPNNDSDNAHYAKLIAMGNTNSASGDGRLTLARGEASASLSSGDVIGMIAFSDNTFHDFALIKCVTDAASGSDDNPGALTFETVPDGSTANAERMRIDNSGDIRIGATTALISSTEVVSINNNMRGNTLALYTQGGANIFSIDMWNSVGGSCKQVQFRSGGSGAVVGSITSTGDNATQYNTSSDYRLKENVNYTWDATTRLKQLKPAQFNWISDETNTAVDGFLAHEVSSVVPEAVTGEKDETQTLSNVVLNSGNRVIAQDISEDDWTSGKANAVFWTEEDVLPEGISVGDVRTEATYPSDSTWEASHTEPIYQGIDHSVLVPLLVKTIQELEARITTLEG